MKLTKVIITAMQEEADLIIKKYGLKEVLDDKSIPKGIKVFSGERKDYDEDTTNNIILVLSGIGKIQASLATTYIFENYDVYKLVNVGIAGNLDNGDVKIGDVFIPNTFIQHDMYLPFKGEHLDYAKKPIFLDYAIGENYDLQKFGLILSGVCLTGDQFIDDKQKTRELREKYSGDIVEMEAFAILSVARAYDMLDKCVVIKAVSDGADSESKDAHMNNLEFAMENSISVLELVL